MRICCEGCWSKCSDGRMVTGKSHRTCSTCLGDGPVCDSTWLPATPATCWVWYSSSQEPRLTNNWNCSCQVTDTGRQERREGHGHDTLQLNTWINQEEACLEIHSSGTGERRGFAQRPLPMPLPHQTQAWQCWLATDRFFHKLQACVLNQVSIIPSFPIARLLLTVLITECLCLGGGDRQREMGQQGVATALGLLCHCHAVWPLVANVGLETRILYSLSAHQRNCDL